MLRLTALEAGVSHVGFALYYPALQEYLREIEEPEGLMLLHFTENDVDDGVVKILLAAVLGGELQGARVQRVGDGWVAVLLPEHELKPAAAGPSALSEAWAGIAGADADAAVVGRLPLELVGLLNASQIEASESGGVQGIIMSELLKPLTEPAADLEWAAWTLNLGSEPVVRTRLRFQSEGAAKRNAEQLDRFRTRLRVAAATLLVNPDANDVPPELVRSGLVSLKALQLEQIGNEILLETSPKTIELLGGLLGDGFLRVVDSDACRGERGDK